jgi:hypothetical protein
MALTKVDNICKICGAEIVPGSAIYITKVNLTTNGRTGPESGMSFGGAYRKTPDGKLRIQHLGSCKPKFCVHEDCFEKLMPAGKKKR